jgi:hypothetical protein
MDTYSPYSVRNRMADFTSLSTEGRAYISVSAVKTDSDPDSVDGSRIPDISQPRLLKQLAQHRSRTRNCLKISHQMMDVSAI